MAACPKCGFDNEQEAKSCVKCGVIFAKVSRLRSEQLRAQRLSELSEKALDQDESLGRSALYEMTSNEDYYRQTSYTTAHILSNFLYMASALTALATLIAAIWTWNVLAETTQIFLINEFGQLFSLHERVLLVGLEVLGGFTFAALIAAAASGLHLGRDIALNTMFTKEYLLRNLSANTSTRQHENVKLGREEAIF